jgi:hypothetical protein
MLVARALRSLLVAVTLASALGCASMEKECQRVCEWEAQCVAGAVGVDDCSAQCVNDSQSRSSDCQSAFDDFASCTNDNQNSCAGVDQQCSSQATHVIDKCSCANPTGPMKTLCGM